MWYLKLVETLIIPKIPPENREGAKFFLSTFFDNLRKELFSNEPAIPLVTLFGMITKLYIKFENPLQLSLVQFYQYTLSLSLVYSKIAVDTSIWNSDFIPLFEKMQEFFDTKKEIQELTEDIQTKRKLFPKENQRMTARQEAINFHLNQLEKEIILDLDNEVTVDFSQVETIFYRFVSFSDLHMFYSYVEEAELFVEVSPEFEMLMLPVLLQKLRIFVYPWPELKAKEVFFQTILKTKSEWENMQKEIIKLARDETAIELKKDTLKQGLQNLLKAIQDLLLPEVSPVLEAPESTYCQAVSLEKMFQFYTEFSKVSSFLAPILEKISQKIAFSNTEPLMAGFRELTRFANRFPLSQKRQILAFIEKLKYQLDVAIVQNPKEINSVKSAIRQKLLQEIKNILFQETSVNTLRSFCSIKANLFTPLQDEIFLWFKTIQNQPLLVRGIKHLESIRNALRALNDAPNEKKMTQLVKQAKKMAEDLFYAVQKQNGYEVKQIKIQFRVLINDQDMSTIYSQMWRIMISHLDNILEEIKVEKQVNPNSFFESHPKDEPSLDPMLLNGQNSPSY